MCGLNQGDQVGNQDEVAVVTEIVAPPVQRPKLPISRRQDKTTGPPSTSQQTFNSPKASPSSETLATAGPGAQKIWQFMPTPTLVKKKKT
ncbi:hypothetical protein PIB30_038802 [Stylosanthes scabra]|uniref:Uncharacterized protein n=1 Tax=Stylosanthes scabra TaxID=79078 RepID=A0ABU6QDJ2_9FABA|nr:hypothetical protein [Stylosanthes scabra]